MDFGSLLNSPFWPPSNVDGDLSPEALSYCSHIRRPAFFLRGAPVSPELAKELIARTDDSLYDLDPPEYWEDLWAELLRSGAPVDIAELARSGSISYFNQCHFNNWWFDSGHEPMGWCHFDGAIGMDGITQKYPDMAEYIRDWAPLAAAYPRLELVALPLKLDEGVLDWSRYPYRLVTAQDTALVRWYADRGFYIHDGRMTLLSAKDAFRLFLEFQSRYPYSDSPQGKEPLPDRAKFLTWARSLFPATP